MKYVNLLVFAVLVAISSYLFDEYFVAEKTAGPRATFERRVTEDFHKLKSGKVLPAEITEIHEVFISDHRTKKFPVKWENLVGSIFPKASDPAAGKYNLQIEAFDDTKDPITVLQLSLFEVGNHNKIWELSRTYPSPAEPVSK